MEVGNSQVLLEKLRKGDLDFALIEGIIDKVNYHSLLFCRERFIPFAPQVQRWQARLLSLPTF